MPEYLNFDGTSAAGRTAAPPPSGAGLCRPESCSGSHGWARSFRFRFPHQDVGRAGPSRTPRQLFFLAQFLGQYAQRFLQLAAPHSLLEPSTNDYRSSSKCCCITLSANSCSARLQRATGTSTGLMISGFRLFTLFYLFNLFNSIR